MCWGHFLNISSESTLISRLYSKYGSNPHYTAPTSLPFRTSASYTSMWSWMAATGGLCSADTTPQNKQLEEGHCATVGRGRTNGGQHDKRGNDARLEYSFSSSTEARCACKYVKGVFLSSLYINISLCVYIHLSKKLSWLASVYRASHH